MYRTYEFMRTANGEQKLEIVMLLSPKKCDFDQILHRIGLELCTEQIKKNPSKTPTELTFEQLMERLTPEMLRPYGITLFWPRENVKQVDGKYPVASRYELDLYREIYDKSIKQVRDQRTYAERIARRLESVKAQGHPVISTWDSKTISIKSVLWSFMFVRGEENDFVKFFDRKVQEAKPLAGSEAKPLVGTDAGSDDPVEQVFQ